MTTKEVKLRFAALRRVSTEQQEDVGESLRTQAVQLKKYVAELGGSIVAWYGGQEHATAGYEKKEVERLTQDAEKQPKRFDAVIVTDQDRWSRDNSSSQMRLEVFRNHEIRFFTGTTEWNLFNPSHVLFLGMNAEIGKFFALNQMKKSLENRIERAKRGVPTGGKLPYGREFIRSNDRQSGQWKIDPQKHKIIEDCAKRYLAGEAMEDLAKDYQMNAANLWKVLTKVSGPKWQLEFNSKTLNIHEVVVMEVPRLLPDETILAIRAKAEANRTYEHGKIVYDYLFSRMISCAHCGYAMLGQTNHNGLQYYRHLHAERDRVCPGPKRKTWIPASEIEDAVMRHLFETFGNPSAVQRAIEEATPNDGKIQAAIKRMELIAKEVQKVKASRQRILGWSVKGTISDEDAEGQLEGLKEREIKLNEERARLDDELAHLPSRERIQSVSKMIAGQFHQYTKAKAVAKGRLANEAFEEMTWKQKRELCQNVFSGKTLDGRRMGVWITWSDDGKKWRYQIDGHLIEARGPLPKGAFEFGAAPEQQELVSSLRKHSPSNVRQLFGNQHYRFTLIGNSLRKRLPEGKAF